MWVFLDVVSWLLRPVAELLCPVLMSLLQVPLLRNIRSYVAREYAEQVERSEGPLVCRLSSIAVRTVSMYIRCDSYELVLVVSCRVAGVTVGQCNAMSLHYCRYVCTDVHVLSR